MGSGKPRTIAAWVKAIRGHLVEHGSAGHASGVQRFFKEEVRSYGWYTADLRAYGRSIHKELSSSPALMLDVAERLFMGKTLEEKGLGVVIAECSLPKPGARSAQIGAGNRPRPATAGRPPSVAPRTMGERELLRVSAWLDHVVTWADHDALAMFLIGPLLVQFPARARMVTGWSRSNDRWHRRAAAVSLIRGVQRGLFVDRATRVTHTLAADPDDMVQKGLGWLLRVWGSVRPAEVVPLLMAIRPRTSRLVLRTACERLPRVIGKLCSDGS